MKLRVKMYEHVLHLKLQKHWIQYVQVQKKICNYLDSDIRQVITNSVHTIDLVIILTKTGKLCLKNLKLCMKLFL